jgi:hypothetical protein
MEIDLFALISKESIGSLDLLLVPPHIVPHAIYDNLWRQDPKKNVIMIGEVGLANVERKFEQIRRNFDVTKYEAEKNN